MKLITDTNKIIACLLRDGKVRRILFIPFLELYTVQHAFEEIEKHKDKLLTKVSESAFDLILLKAKKRLKSVEFSAEDRECIRTAKKIAEEFDPDDFPFIALSLKLNAPIWTNDKKLIEFSLKTKKYTALDTQAIEDILSGKDMKVVLEELKKRVF